MFWIVMLVASGIIAMIIDRAGFTLLILLAAAVLAYFAFVGAVWINNAVGFQYFIVDSWKFLSGVQDPADMMSSTCTVYADNFLAALLGLIYIFVLGVIVICNAIVALASIIGIPLGAILTILGAIGTLIFRDKSYFAMGVYFLCLALAGLIVSGLVMRILHAASTLAPCY